MKKKHTSLPKRQKKCYICYKRDEPKTKWNQIALNLTIRVAFDVVDSSELKETDNVFVHTDNKRKESI